MKCWYVTFLQTADTFTLIFVTGHVPYRHFNKKCHITFRLQAQDLAVMPGGGEGGDGVTGDMATQPLPAIGYLKVGPFPAVFVATKPGVINETTGQFLAMF